MLENALEDSIAKIKELSVQDPNERLPKEEQIRCFLYHFYTSHSIIAHPEAAYFPAEHGSKEECDLRIIFPDRNEEWIELKTARCATGLQTKLSEESRKWDKDGWKLDHAPSGATRTFVLFTFTEDNPDDHDIEFFSKIIDLWPKYPVKKISTHELNWRDTAVKYVTAWFWQW